MKHSRALHGGFWVVKEEGGENDLLSRIAADPQFGVTREELDKLVDPRLYVGRAPQQTEDFLNEVIDPILSDFSDLPQETAEIDV